MLKFFWQLLATPVKLEPFFLSTDLINCAGYLLQ